MTFVKFSRNFNMKVEWYGFADKLNKQHLNDYNKH